MEKKIAILSGVEKYYAKKLKEFGATSKGVDWNSEESQKLRFDKLVNIINKNSSFSLLDYGCGFGAMYPYLKNIFGNNFAFTGFDISIQMINEALILHNEPNAKWINNINEATRVDYVIASGIFNVRLDHTKEDWEEYILETLIQLNSLSIKGFAFNMLTSYSDKEFMKNHLYYANPATFFDFCKRNFSKYVVLRHDYPLYEFTIEVKKD